MIISQFSERLNERLKEIDMSVDDLALKSKINRATIYRYLKGDISNAGMDYIIALANALNVSAVWLCGWSETKYNRDTSSNEISKKLIPLIGIIHAGTPMYAEENIEKYLSCEDTECDYALRVKGNSMIGARIYDGDIAYIRKQDDVDSGEIGVCIVNGDEATLKRVYKYGNKIVLHPENPTLEDIEFTKSDKTLKIIGKLIKVEFKAK